MCGNFVITVIASVAYIVWGVRGASRANIGPNGAHTKKNLVVNKNRLYFLSVLIQRQPPSVYKRLANGLSVLDVLISRSVTVYAQNLHLQDLFEQNVYY